VPTERQEIDYDAYDHIMSASQLSTFQLCERKWAFQSLFRMPRQESESNVFGTTLHGVAERWLKADDLGRDLEGKPVEMYPNDWDKDLSPANASAIRSLIDKAITSGVLERRAGRQIEEPIFDEVIPGVRMQGYIDMLLPGEIQDHKSAKNTRYIKTPATLATDTQMLVYAHHAIESGGGIGRDEHIILRHNVFVRQPPKVIRTETQVAKLDVMKFWNEEVIPAAARMVELKKKGLTENDWRNFRGPADENSACNAYGGCPFLSICSGHRSPSDLRNLLDGVQSGSINQQQQGTSTVSIFDKLVVGGTPAGTLTASSAPAVPASSGNAAAPAVVSPPTGAPPWAQANCNSCKGVGFNLKTGGACFVCTSMSRSKNGPVPEQFIINVVSGVALWRSQDGTQKGDVRLEVGSQPVKTQVREALPAADAASLAAMDGRTQVMPPNTVEQVAAQIGAPVPGERPALDVTIEPPVKRGRGRPKKVTLVQGVQPITPAMLVAMGKELVTGVVDQVIAEVSKPQERDESDLIASPNLGTVASEGTRITAESPATKARLDAAFNEKRGGIGGLTLIIGAVQIGGMGVANGVSRDLSALIRDRIGPDLAKKQGVSSFFSMPAYTRRDALVQAAEAIANSLGTMIVTVQRSDADAKALADAMIPHASVAFIGVN
jgi:hypothetical protein